MDGPGVPELLADRPVKELTGLLPIGRVSTLVGVPSPTIRSWERRYGLAVGTRSTLGHRRYSVLDVASLSRMRDEVATGRPAAEAAALVNATLAATPTDLCTTLLEASHAYDPGTVLETLDRSVWLYGLGRTVDEVVFPALRETGNQWVQRNWDIAQEHLASTTIQGWLRGHQRRTRSTTGGGVVLLCCGPEEEHTLGLDALAALLAQHGVTTLNLGARTPAASVRTTVARVPLAAVVVSCHLSSGRPAALGALRAAARDGGPPVFYAGGAFRTASTRAGVPGTYLGSNLERAAALLAERVGAESPGAEPSPAAAQGEVY